MENLWRPWRIKYILSDKEQGCIFCDKPKEQKDKENYILYRGKTGFIMLNIYPYNSGHLMVAPYKHVPTFEDLGEADLIELFLMVNKSTKLLKYVMQPHGFNIGANLGKVAGAGVKDHVHLHIVPRWEGDTNFMLVIAEANVIPESLDSVFEKLSEALDKV
jgi:ATP adenylyltransferase